ncbi:MAG: uracil phosphoribosyltransferase [Bacteroidales bacterium]|jgi:uracil phosphoribosyltransferase|nr:uracil phosphoribosyltransferase [Bacteroidales bacterium]
MKIYNLGEHNSLFNVFVSEIRDKITQKDSMRFRHNLRRMGEIFAYEISKHFEYENIKIETPLGVKEMGLPTKQPIVCSVLRAGVLLHEGILSYYDKAESAFISAYRKHDAAGRFHIELGYVACPSLEDKTLILCDPMLATGASLEVCYRSLIKYGKPRHTHFVSAIASVQGVEYLQKKLKGENFTLWIGGMDEELSIESYIVPGLGDAGDLAYGNKLQE